MLEGQVLGLGALNPTKSLGNNGTHQACWITALLCKQEAYVKSPAQRKKPGMAVRICNPSIEGQDRQLTRAHWPTDMIKFVLPK